MMPKALTKTIPPIPLRFEHRLPECASTVRDAQLGISEVKPQTVHSYTRETQLCQEMTNDE